MKDRENEGTLPGPAVFTAPHSRRLFLKGMGLAAGATAILPTVAVGQNADAETEEIPGLKILGRGEQKVTLKVNGASRTVAIEPRETLLNVLRTKLGLTGSKEVCDRGTCGCCTVLLDGASIVSCLMLAIDAVGHEVTTIEGVADDPKNAALIDAFCEHDAAQCGYCIPGIVVRSSALLDENPAPTAEEIRQGLSGNICRCGTYTKIFDAVGSVSKGGRT
ncbi:MAG: xanthine dehydrogenase YagT iron-sulfur-binding subunit [Candidatus Sumerlaeota bacterium]|nr:xanthine dehydrogenase YagT iron-sulfur-binding subunit [Candidatus Sumerlaeota bacterium]